MVLLGICRIHLLLVAVGIAVIIPAVRSESLRHRSSSSNSRTTSVDNNATLSIGRRHLQGTYDNSSSISTVVTLSEDGQLLNSLIELVLPAINKGIELFTPDPLNLDIAGTFNVGSLDLGCGATGLDFNYNWGGITGLSSFFIDSLTIVPGTEQVTAGLTESQWKGTFNMAITSATSFAIDNLGAGFDASVCGANWYPAVDGTIVTREPFMSGAVELAGSLCNGSFNIDESSILESLEITFSSITAQLSNVPDSVNAFLGPVSERMSVLLQDTLVATVEPTVRPIIENQIKDEGQTFAPAKIFPIHAALVRNAARRGIRNMYNNTLQFIGF